MNTITYNDWSMKATQAWDMILDLSDQQSELVCHNNQEIAFYEELQMEIKEWQHVAEFAEMMMLEIEKCLNYNCTPAQLLFIPGTPEEIVRNEVFG